MNIRSSKVTYQRRQLWIGIVEVRSQREHNEILGAAKGAFVSIVTWAASTEDYRHNAERVIESLGGVVLSDVLNSEPVDERRARIGGHFEEEIEDLIRRAQASPNAILYGPFHLFEKDDA